MNRDREYELETDATAKLTESEIAEGWHFCPNWDFMIIGPGCPELDYGCNCTPPQADPK